MHLRSSRGRGRRASPLRVVRRPSGHIDHTRRRHLTARLPAGADGLGSPGFVLAIAAWLWLTVLFANFAEAVAEGRGKAQAAALRSTRREVQAKKLQGTRREDGHRTTAIDTDFAPREFVP